MASKNVRVKLTRVTINNPSLFRKRATIEDGPEKYRANFTIDASTKQGKKNIALMEAAIDEVMTEEFGKTDVKIKEGRMCLLDGNDIQNDDGEVYQGYADMMVVRATNNKRPKVVDIDGETPLTEDDDKIYGGAVVNAYVDVYAISDKKFGGKGVFATVMGAQYIAEGERFGGGNGLGDDAFTDESGSDDDDDDAPKKSKSKAKPKSKSRDEDDDDDEDEPPKKSKSKAKTKAVDEDDDDEDEPPKKSKSKAKSKPRDEDEDDEDEPPKKSKSKAKSRARDDDDEDDDEVI